MSEFILLLCIVIIIILSQYFLTKLNPKQRLYVRITAGILLLILIWGSAENKNIPFKVIISVLVLQSLFNEYIHFNKK